MPSIDNWNALGELLLLANRIKGEGSVDDQIELRKIFNVVKVWARRIRGLEDLRTGRLATVETVTGHLALRLKYADAFDQSLKGNGFAKRGDNLEVARNFPFEFIETAVTPQAEPGDGSDWARVLDTFWPLSLSLRYLLRAHARTTEQYKYAPGRWDAYVLLRWFLSIPGTKTAWIRRDLQDREWLDVQSHLGKYGAPSNLAKQFMSKYIDSQVLVPIIAKTPRGWLLGSRTLLLFLVYLHGFLESNADAYGVGGMPVIEAMRKKAAKKFEDWIREQLFQQGFTGPSAAFQSKYDYDILAISEERRLILLGDAKYRDFPYSSFSGENLIRNEVLGDHGLQREASRQQDRLEHFKSNGTSFAAALKPQLPWEQYQVRSFLISKNVPVIRRYKDVELFEVRQFLSLWSAAAGIKPANDT